MVCSSSLEAHTQRSKDHHGGDGVNGIPNLGSFGRTALPSFDAIYTYILENTIYDIFKYNKQSK